ncbi:MAG: hypothetical protein M1828_002424 [Chrysothrix sp. TS-e1954]|nr:MAG: hypothetical protein M1828_002424 [Chrysothrix sp. TS-e1954]
MQTNGRTHSHQRSHGSANYKGSHSYTSSSEDSYGRINSLSRSESGTSQTHYEDMMPSPKVLTNGYTQGSMDWGRPQSAERSSMFRSQLQHNADPVALHLLVETAVGESVTYDILSVEELDNLKREEAHISRQIDGVRRRLHLETKVRNAAKSLSRISSRGGESQSIAKLKRQRGSDNFSNDDHAAIVQKCDDLAQELWRLEKRQSELQAARLKHTAGVLQLSHQERSTQGAPHQSKDWRTSDDWGLGDLADTEDGIMEIPGSNSRQTDAALNNLWQMIVNHERSLQDRPDNHSGSRGFTADGDDDSLNQEFSLEGFSALVQRICARASNLSKQHMALDAQLHNEREQRSQVEGVKAREISELLEQLQDAHDQHQVGQRALKDFQSQAMESRADLDQLQQELAYTRQQYEFENAQALDGERTSRAAEKQDMLAHINDTKTQLEQVEQARAQADHSLQAAKAQIANHEAMILSLQASDSGTSAKLVEASASLQRAEEVANEKSKQHDHAVEERRGMEAEVVRLQTEVTVARAELDGAYGTRAQRAAEVAANPEVRKELEELTAKNQETENRAEMLGKELRELVTEHETLVKQGVEAERERDSLETLLDTLRERIERLEVRLSEERVTNMGKPSNSTGTSNDTPRDGEGTSMSVMRSEFKKMMREARAEHFRGVKEREYTVLPINPFGTFTWEKRPKSQHDLRHLRDNQIRGIMKDGIGK